MTAFTRSSHPPSIHPRQWRTAIGMVLAFWISGTLLLDLVIMPGLFFAGMMTQPSFATAGYSIFGLFNRIELVCAALVLTGVLILRVTQPKSRMIPHWTMPLALGLLAVALLYTYGLTPKMIALGASLNGFESAVTIPALMGRMHSEYWLLELFKLLASGLLLKTIWQSDPQD